MDPVPEVKGGRTSLPPAAQVEPVPSALPTVAVTPDAVVILLPVDPPATRPQPIPVALPTIEVTATAELILLPDYPPAAESELFPSPS